MKLFEIIYSMDTTHNSVMKVISEAYSFPLAIYLSKQRNPANCYAQCPVWRL